VRIEWNALNAGAGCELSWGTKRQHSSARRRQSANILLCSARLIQSSLLHLSQIPVTVVRLDTSRVVVLCFRVLLVVAIPEIGGRGIGILMPRECCVVSARIARMGVLTAGGCCFSLGEPVGKGNCA